MRKFDLVIIGSGLAGYSLAKEWRKLSQGTLAIITAENADYYSKPQLSTALAFKKSASDLVMKTKEQMQQDLDASIFSNTVVHKVNTEQKTVKTDAGEFAFSKLVFACGADTINLNLTGSGADDVLSVNNINDYNLWREKLNQCQKIAVIGSGLVGCEFAHDLLKAGFAVDVLSIESRPLARMLPESLASCFAAAMQKEGVNWHFNRAATAVEKVENSYILKTEQGDSLECDLVLSAVGLQPHVKLAEQSLIKTARGIETDDYLQTSADDVFALGDCAQVGGQVRLYVAPLLQCAKALAKTLCGDKTAVVFPPMPIVVKTSLAPVCVLAPGENIAGTWQVAGEGADLVARFVSEEGKVCGFALTGKCVRERMALLKEIA
jgi:rubredoxin---NAD+ reductase